MNEDDMKDEVYRQLQEAMDAMGAKKGDVKAITEVEAPPEKSVWQKLKEKGEGKIDQPTYGNKGREDVLNQSESESPGGMQPKEKVPEMPKGGNNMDEEESMFGSSFVRGRKRR